MILTELKISRPLRWPLLIVPFFVGAFAADTTNFFWPALAVFAFYFTFPANILLYGINDIADLESDRKGGHKAGRNLVTVENRWRIANIIILWNLPFCVVWLADEMPNPAKLALLGFLFFGIFYSLKPIRAKTKPLLDSLFNVLYIFPGLFAYGLLEYRFPPWQLIAAAGLWSIAMHAYMSIPKISADKKAGISSVATLLRPLGTLVFCMVAIAAAATLSYPWLKMFALGAGLFYLIILLATFIRAQPAKPFALYRFSPVINALAGVGLIVYISQIVK